MKVDNAIILAAGTASRFAPLSFEMPKALREVRGEVLIERQIKQLREVGINEIVIVVGYKKEAFFYLVEKYGVILVENKDYLTKNNHSSIYAVRKYLKNSYICSSDNYFFNNPFESEVDENYYSSIYVEGETNEWCIEEKDGYIKKVTIGGHDSWIMLGHVFWSEKFSKKFLTILNKEYDLPETADKLWETIYIEHIDELTMKIRKYPSNFIFEFDTLDELREFDSSYKNDTRSSIIKKVIKELNCKEEDIINVKAFRDKDNSATGFIFDAGKKYKFYYKTQQLEEIL